MNAIEQHAGWGAEYFVDRELRELGVETQNLDYRQHRWNLADSFLSVRDFDALLLQRGEDFPLDLIRAVRRPRFFWASELVDRRADQHRLLKSGLFSHVFLRTPACRTSVASRGWLSMDHTSLLRSGFDPGLHRRLTNIGARDIDVLFVGSLTVRRRRILKRLAQGLPITIRRGVFGEDLVQLFNRAKIVLNIHAAECLDTETRVYEALGCGAFLLSEELSPESPFQPGVHYVQVSDVEGFEGEVARYLLDEAARTRVANAGLSEVHKHHTWGARAGEIACAIGRELDNRELVGPAIDRQLVHKYQRKEIRSNIVRTFRAKGRVLCALGRRVL